MATRSGITKAIATLQALGVQGGPDRANEATIRAVIDVWAKVLEPMTDVQLEAAVVDWVGQSGADGRFWPTPGNLLSRDPVRKLEAVDDSAEVWGKLLAYASQGKLYSRYGCAVIELSPAVQAGVDACGGREAIATSNYEAHSWMQATFRRAYQANRQAGAVLEQHPQLTTEQAGSFLRLVDRGGT
jgi:hypothetical protein